MKKIRELFSGFFGLFIGLYFLSVNVMGVLYTYRDIKVHDSFARYLFISPIVGVFKATHWPYYEFFKSNQFAEAVEYEGSVKAFFISQQLFNAGNEAVKEKTSQSSKAAYQFMKSARDNVLKCNAEELNAVYAGWGTIVRDKFIPALDVIIEMMDEKLNADPKELAKGEILLQEYFDWSEAHGAELRDSVKRHVSK